MEHLKRLGAGVAVIMLVLFIYWLVYLFSALLFGYTIYVVGILAIPGAYLFGWVLRESDEAGRIFQMGLIHGFFKWGWYLGWVIAALAVCLHWLLTPESGLLAIAAACVLWAFSCAVGEFCLFLSGDMNDDRTT